MSSPKKMTTLNFLLVSLSLYSVTCAAGPVAKEKQDDPFYYLKVIDAPAPFCEGQVKLEAGKEAFVEIANELPGRDEYNELVRIAKRSAWDIFDLKWQEFRTNFSDSPLVEAGAFLYLQTRFDRIDRDDGSQSKEVEKLLREAALAYPKSTLAPAVWATAAQFMMKQGLGARALSLYEKGEHLYQNSDFNCVFKLGTAETNYLIRDFKPAIKKFEEVIRNCENSRLKVASQIRISDIRLLQDEAKAAETMYEKIILESDAVVERYFPSVLYNLGEIKYRDKNYASARHFFNRFYQIESKEAKCMPHALKRIADTSFRLDPTWHKAAGYYFAVHEQAPYTDVGRFSYIHGLLIGLPNLPKIEYQRRLKVIDNEIDKMKDRQLREIAYMEKGLVLLDAAEEPAMDYLVRLNDRMRDVMTKGAIADFIRERLLRVLKKEVQSGMESDAASESFFQPIEAAYKVWLKGTPNELQAQKYYSELVLHRFDQHMKDDDLEAATTELEKWTETMLWNKSGPDWEARQRVGESLSELVFDFEGEPEESPSYFLLKKEKLLSIFLKPEFVLLWAQIAMDTGDKKRLEKIASSLKNQRGLAAVDPKISEELQGRMWLAAAEALGMLNDFRGAERAYEMVLDEPLQERALTGRMKLHTDRKDWKSAFPVAEKLLPYLKGEKRQKLLSNTLEIVLQGKLWEKASQVLGWAKELRLDAKELAPFHYLTGRAHFERKEYRLAIESLENALKADPTAETASESQFRLGKALEREKRVAQARVIFRELAAKKDPFWSPLANNEMKSLK